MSDFSCNFLIDDNKVVSLDVIIALTNDTVWLQKQQRNNKAYLIGDFSLFLGVAVNERPFILGIYNEYPENKVFIRLSDGFIINDGLAKGLLNPFMNIFNEKQDFFEKEFSKIYSTAPDELFEF